MPKGSYAEIERKVDDGSNGHRLQKGADLESWRARKEEIGQPMLEAA